MARESADPRDLSLEALGWSAFFADQLTAAEAGRLVPARVFATGRKSVTAVFVGGSAELPLGGRWFRGDPEARPTIGDWLVLDARCRAIERRLGRRSLLKRRAAGREHEVQLIAANVDTMFLVSACNEEFKPSRIERYLALALDAGVEPVVVLTKADLVADAASFVAAVRRLKRDLAVAAVDARDPAALEGVRGWCGVGRTVALLGSSGVGKSTLVNTLCGQAVQRTREARQDDAKGRHTTTRRSLHLLPDGGVLVDNPGMRELSLAEAELGAAELFDDLAELAEGCRFRDCRHDSEPGCAVRAAIERGELDVRRLESFRKIKEKRGYG
ncbi:MAG: ribosome small subunit-dependent GTPase A [Pseudomonadota bacterium]